ncbi:MAG: aldose epimerase family protein [Alphaproteobacteria bacterium]
MTTPASVIFGYLADGQPVVAYKLAAGGMRATILSYGATLQDLRIEGQSHSLVLNSDQLDDYKGSLINAGAIIGPVANRIANAELPIAEQIYRLDRNFRARHCLHGGTRGAGQLLWSLDEHYTDRLRLTLRLADQHMGFPGPINASVEYRLTESNQLDVRIEASSESLVAMNWTEHSYFNLDGTDTLSQHSLRVLADDYLPVDEDLIPVGDKCSVVDTRFDFRKPRSLNEVEIDHNFCTSSRRNEPLRPVAWLASEQSSVSLLIESNEPGLQVYTGTHLRPNPSGMKAGIALEPQGWPDAVHHPDFPSTLYRPSEVYKHHSRYTFQTKNR